MQSRVNRTGGETEAPHEEGDDLMTDGGEPADAEQPGAGDPDDYRIPTIEELDAMRVAAGLSMKDLSDCAGFKSNRFSHILNNDTNPQTRTIRAFLTTLQAFDGHSPSGEQGPDPEPSELVDDDSDGPTEVDVDRIAARLRRLDPDAVGEDPTPPDADENLLTDGGRCSVGTERFSPNAVERYSGTKECNYGRCRETADWDIHLVDRHSTPGLVRACDEHVENYWGYHPEENRSVDTGSDRSDE